MILRWQIIAYPMACTEFLLKRIQALFMVVHSELGVCEVYARGKEDN